MSNNNTKTFLKIRWLWLSCSKKGLTWSFHSHWHRKCSGCGRRRASAGMQTPGSCISLSPSALRVLGAAPALDPPGTAPCGGHWSHDCCPFVLGRGPFQPPFFQMPKTQPSYLPVLWWPWGQISHSPQWQPLSPLAPEPSSEMQKGLWAGMFTASQIALCVQLWPQWASPRDHATAGTLPSSDLPTTCKLALPVPFLPWHEWLSRDVPCPWYPSHFCKAYLLSARNTIRSEGTPAKNVAEVPKSAGTMALTQWVSLGDSPTSSHGGDMDIVHNGSLNRHKLMHLSWRHSQQSTKMPG